MTAFLKITDDELVALPLQLVVRCIGLDFELGGTMRITVHHDPLLTEGNLLREADLAALARRLNDPSILSLEPVKTVYSSPRSQQLLALNFRSDPQDNTMVWHLVSGTKEIARVVNSLPGRLGLDVEPLAVARETFLALHHLTCWRQVNVDKFKSFQITIDENLAALLPGVEPAEDSASGSGFVIGTGRVGV